jgi:hypothetical protein
MSKLYKEKKILEKRSYLENEQRAEKGKSNNNKSKCQT